MNCLICESREARRIGNISGYIKGENYEIFECLECNSQFIFEDKIDNKIYNLIYANEYILGYDRYLKYAREVKKEKNPLKYLSDEETTYFPIYKYLINQPKSKILEVGCGYGYLSYSLHALGHDVIGIDISEVAIDFARMNLGNYFRVSDVKEIKESDFDFIIATELFEHLINPNEFISLCANLLNEDGKIILTIPNKDYYRKENNLWQTDLPPVHITWLGRNSLKKIASRNNMKCEFIDLVGHFDRNNNKLIDFIVSRLKNKQNPLLDEQGNAIVNGTYYHNSVFRKAVHAVLFLSPVRYICNSIFRLIAREDKTLAVVMHKINFNKD